MDREEIESKRLLSLGAAGCWDWKDGLGRNEKRHFRKRSEHKLRLSSFKFMACLGKGVF